MKCRFSCGRIDNTIDLVNPRCLGLVRRDVNLLCFTEGQQGEDAEERGGVHKSSFIDEDEVGGLTSDRLEKEIEMYFTRTVEAKLYAETSYLTFDPVETAKCYLSDCGFIKRSPQQPRHWHQHLQQHQHHHQHYHQRADDVWMCEQHGRAHICNQATTCKELMMAVKMIGGIKPTEGSICVFTKEAVCEKKFPRGVLARGLSQKMREAFIYDKNERRGTPIDFSVNNRCELKTTSLHITCEEILLHLTPLLVSFFNSINSDWFKCMYDNVVVTRATKNKSSRLKDDWLLSCENGALSNEIEEQIVTYIRIIGPLLYNTNMKFFITQYKLAIRCSECNECLLVLILCVYKLVDTMEYDIQSLVYIFFKKCSAVTQAFYTVVDKTVNRLFWNNSLKASRWHWSPQLLDLLENLNVHAHLSHLA